MNVLILAGERVGGDPLAKAEHVAYKADILIMGKTMLSYVIDAVRPLKQLERIYISSPESQGYFSDIIHIAPAASPCRSVIEALSNITFPVLLTTADHPLLTTAMLEDFVKKSSALQGDIGVGLVPLSVIMQHYPESRRTRLKFKGEAYSGANMFFIKNSQALALFHFWQQVEALRKSPLRMIQMLGIAPLLRYMIGQLTLHEVITLLEKRTGTKIAPVYLDNPHAGIDVDKPSDLALVRDIIGKRIES